MILRALAAGGGWVYNCAMSKRLSAGSGKWDGRAAAAGRLIGRAARARRVVLFGSAARGEADERSDWDFLVVIPARRHRWTAAARGREAVRESGMAHPSMDILVFREAEVERGRGCQYSVVHHALKDGREVWHE